MIGIEKRSLETFRQKVAIENWLTSLQTKNFAQFHIFTWHRSRGILHPPESRVSQNLDEKETRHWVEEVQKNVSSSCSSLYKVE